VRVVTRRRAGTGFSTRPWRAIHAIARGRVTLPSSSMKSGVVTPFAGSARGPADRRGARPRVAGRRSPREPVTADAEELGRGGVETRAAAPAFDDAVDVRAGQGSPGERPRRQAHPRNVVVHDVRRGDGAVFLEVDASERVVDDLLGTDCCRGRLFLRAPVRGLSERRRAIGLRSSELPAPSDFAISAVAKKSYAPAVTCAKRRRCAGLLRTSRSRSLSGAPRTRTWNRRFWRPVRKSLSAGCLRGARQLTRHRRARTPLAVVAPSPRSCACSRWSRPGRRRSGRSQGPPDHRPRAPTTV